MMKDAKKIRLGIIGLGNQGSLYTRILTGTDKNVPGRPGHYAPDNMVLGAFCDNDPKKEEQYKKAYPDIPFYSDWKEMVVSGKIDAVVTTVPHYLHAPIAIYCLEHGMNVLVEKPASVPAKHVRRMNECAAKHPELTYGIMFNQRTNPLYQQVRDLIHSGKLGELRRTVWICNRWWRTDAYYQSSDWRATWGGEGGGILVNQVPHQLDLWQWMVDVPVKVTSVCVNGAHREIDVENDVTFITEYANGATGVFVACTHDMMGTDRLEVDLSQGKIVIEDNKAIVTTFAYDESYVNKHMDMREAFELTRGNGASADGKKNETEIITLDQTRNTQHGGVMENYADHILNGTPLLAPGSEGINGVQLANAVQLSAWLGKTVELPVDEDLYLEELNKLVAIEGKFDSIPMDL